MKLILSALSLAAIFWLGGVVFFANPINWRTDMYWLNWQALVSNGTIVCGVGVGWWLVTRRYLRSLRKKPNQSTTAQRASRVADR